jgi:imidazolonepropionase-like amidohydrolase
MRAVLVSLTAALFSLTLVLLSPTVFLAQSNVATDQRPVAFTHITVIDATGKPAQPDMTVVVSGTRISALGKTGSVAIPNGAQVADSAGKFMIPGLWDMHQHTFMRKNKILPLLSLWGNIINGVTGVRDMGDQGLPDDFGDLPYIQDFEWRQAIEAGSVIGPRLSLPGVILEGPPSPRKGWPEMRTPDQAREEVRFLKKLGVDFIKVHDSLPRDVYFAIADESKKQGLVFAGHVTNTVSVAEASDAGQKSEEHMLGILVACSTNEAELMKAVREHGLLSNAKALVDTFSEEKARALYAKFVKNGTYIMPSFLREWGSLKQRPLNDPRMAFGTPALRTETEGQAKNFKPANVPAAEMIHKAHYRIVKEMQAAGVKLIAGTDGRLFGFDLHDELEEEATAGLTPMQTLQTATRNAADYLGLLDSLGTVEKGKLADLVVLDANPLDNITNATKIRSVVVNGRLLDRQALDRMEAEMKEAANPIKPSMMHPAR